MISPGDDYITLVVDSVAKELDGSNVKIITMDSYLENYLAHCSSLKEITFPYIINVPRDIDYMLKTGDFSPERQIVIEKPIMYGKVPIWTRSSLKGVGLGFGYENCNKRELSDIFIGNVSSKSGPHSHIAGKSGGGKSVALANIIYNMLFAYSPYEVNIHLIDAKIAEAARYGNGSLISHIKTIGATSDIGYMISITEYMTKKAEKLNQLFGKLGVNNLEDFRKETGLTMPRDIIIVDEYQLQYQKATSSEANQLTTNYDKLCTAGRSSGTHLMLCTQSFLPELKSALFKNIEVRAALTCEPKTSEGVLGNFTASDCKNIGEIYVNLASDQSIESTRMFRVPFQSKEDFDKHKDFLANACDQYQMDKTLNAFNETVVMDKKDLDHLVDKYSKHKRLVFGEPASLKSKEIDVFYINQTFNDLESMLFFSPKSTDIKEFINTMIVNYSYLPVSNNEIVFLNADRALSSDLELPSHVISRPCRKNDNAMFTYYKGAVYRKAAMIEADEEIFNGYNSIDAGVQKFMSEHFKSRPSMLTELNIKRASLYVQKLKTLNYLKIYGLSNNSLKLDSELYSHAILTLEDLIAYSNDFMTVKVTQHNLPVTYVNIVGIDKIDGLTRGGGYGASDMFKSLLLDSGLGNVCFVCYCTNITGVSEFSKSFRWVVTSNSKNQESKLGLELPKEMQPLLGYLGDPSTGFMTRFKRLNLDLDEDDGLI